MADKWPLANGNWSNAANWNGGTLPTASDDVFADGKTVTIDIDITVLSIRTTQRSGGINGGVFRISTSGISINCTGLGIVAGTTTCLASTVASGNVSITANISGGGQIGPVGLNISSGNATYNIVGNLTAGNFTITHAISCSASSTINLTGNIEGSSASTSVGILNSSAIAILNITGNVTANIGNGIQTSVSAVITVNGIISASNTVPAIYSTSTPSVTVTTPCFNKNGNMAISVGLGKIYIYATSIAEWTFQNESNTDKTLYSPGVALGNPTPSDVRDGTSYASGALTGTLKVPPTNAVSVGVPTDNTVGTAVIDINDMGALLASYII